MCGWYNSNLWESILKFKDKLLEELKQEFATLVDEGRLVATSALQVSLDVVDSSACVMASIIFTHHSSWLQL